MCRQRAAAVWIHEGPRAQRLDARLVDARTDRRVVPLKLSMEWAYEYVEVIQLCTKTDNCSDLGRDPAVVSKHAWKGKPRWINVWRGTAE